MFGELLAGFILASTAMPADAQVDYNRVNDYYAAIADGSGREKAVEQYHLGPGESRLRKREYVQAYSDFVFILKIFPNHPKALVLMIQLCEQWKSPQCKAEEFLERAIAINPKAAGTYTAQGIYLHRNRQYTQAIDSFKHALEIDPSSMNAHYNLGLAYLETKQYELANQNAQRAYALGAPVPGLRRRLEQVGYWKPLPTPDPQTAGSSPKEPAERQDEAAKK